MAWSPAGASEVGRGLYFLDGEGEVYSWEGGAGPLHHHLLPWGPIDDLVPLPNGRQLLALTQAPASSRRRSREGLAVILEDAGTQLHPVREVRFEGRCLRAAVTEDGHRAYLLAHPSPASDAGDSIAGRAWVHEIDLDNAVILSSTILTEPALSVAVGRGGRRIFVGLRDRILTYQTSPLTPSWYFRSPGPNLGLYRPGEGDTLYAVRGREVALFDPAVIEGRSVEARQKLTDDATSVLALADQAAAMLFAAGGPLAAAYGGTPRISFLDPRTGVTATASLTRFEGTAGMIRPLAFAADASTLQVAIFPDAIVGSLPLPAALRTVPVPFAPTTMTPASPAATSPAEATSPTPAPARDLSPEKAMTPTPAPAPSPTSTLPPDGPIAPIRVIAPQVLQGLVTGDRETLDAIAIYGPDSLIMERARVRPGPDGTWQIPLPPPGTYRVLLIGSGSRSLRITPAYRTVVVTPGVGIGGIDFKMQIR